MKKEGFVADVANQKLLYLSHFLLFLIVLTILKSCNMV